MSVVPAPSRSGRSVVRVVIADPHPTVRRALCALLASEPGFLVADAVAALAAAGAAVRRHRADALVVHARLYPGVAAHACRHGAAAYVLKDEAHVRLAALLRDLCQAETRTGMAGVASPP